MITICELCYRNAPIRDHVINRAWDFVWQSFICPDCQQWLAEDKIERPNAKCGMYTFKPDPMANKS